AIEDLLNRGNSVWHPADPRPEGQRHDAPATGHRLPVEPVEMVHYLLDELGWFVLVEMEELQIADLVSVGHGMDRPRLGLEAVRHVVVDPVANILTPFGGDEVERIVAFRVGRRVPTLHGLARQLTQGGK